LVLFVGLVLLLLTATSLLAEGPSAAEQATDETVAGRYAGTISINEPLNLGIMDFAIDLNNSAGKLTARLVTSQTEAFSGEIIFQGTLTTHSQGITPTFSLASNRVSGEISGRSVVRTITLTGNVVDEGETLRGKYREVIEGFTPEALTVEADFLLVRTAVSVAIATPPVVTPGTPGAQDRELYLPVLSHRVATGASASDTPVVPAAETPVPQAQLQFFLPALTSHEPPAQNEGAASQEPIAPSAAQTPEPHAQIRSYLPVLTTHRTTATEQTVVMDEVPASNDGVMPTEVISGTYEVIATDEELISNVPAETHEVIENEEEIQTGLVD
jgi:hypothetical protein